MYWLGDIICLVATVNYYHPLAIFWTQVLAPMDSSGNSAAIVALFTPALIYGLGMALIRRRWR
jgi:hypothetical protein